MFGVGIYCRLWWEISLIDNFILNSGVTSSELFWIWSRCEDEKLANNFFVRERTNSDVGGVPREVLVKWFLTNHGGMLICRIVLDSNASMRPQGRSCISHDRAGEHTIEEELF